MPEPEVPTMPVVSFPRPLVHVSLDQLILRLEHAYSEDLPVPWDEVFELTQRLTRISHIAEGRPPTFIERPRTLVDEP